MSLIFVNLINIWLVKKWSIKNIANLFLFRFWLSWLGLWLYRLLSLISDILFPAIQLFCGLGMNIMSLVNIYIQVTRHFRQFQLRISADYSWNSIPALLYHSVNGLNPDCPIFRQMPKQSYHLQFTYECISFDTHLLVCEPYIRLGKACWMKSFEESSFILTIF